MSRKSLEIFFCFGVFELQKACQHVEPCHRILEAQALKTKKDEERQKREAEELKKFHEQVGTVSHDAMAETYHPVLRL